MTISRISERLISIAIAVFFATYVCGCAKNTQKDLTQPLEPQETAEAPSEGFDMTEDKDAGKELETLSEEQKILSFDMTGYTKDGKKKWDIQGKSADVVSDTVVLNDIEANTYSNDRAVALKADSGVYDKKKSAVKLKDNVMVTTTDGISLTAEWLKWESETNTIKTDSFVEVKKGDFYAAGYGASANTEQKEMQLDKDIFVRQAQISITCEGPLIIDYGKNKASFYDDVKVVDPRGELLADRIDIFFNPDSREIESVVAEQDVKLKRGPNVAKGQKIVYTLASGEAMLTGNPEILIYSKEDFKDAFTGD